MLTFRRNEFVDITWFARRANVPQVVSLVTTGKSPALFRASSARKRGVSRSSRTSGGRCGGRDGRKRRMRVKRTAKPRGP